MKRGLIFLLAFAFIKTNSQADQKEIAEVAKTVSYYLDGGTFGDSVLFSKAFITQGQMLYRETIPCSWYH